MSDTKRKQSDKLVMGLTTCLEVAVTTKCSVGRACCSALMTASFPTPLGPLMMITSGGAGGTCSGPETETPQLLTARELAVVP